jgi:secondary thiamine-phosphate synthase enzyme
MTIHHETLDLETEIRPSFYDVTAFVRQALTRSGVRNGLVVVYSQHTTCSVVIQEDSLDTTFNGTKFIFQDLLDILDRLIPPCQKEGQYLHPGPKCVEHSVNVIQEALPWTLNTDGHLRSLFLGRSESIPVVDGQLQLGEHGCIYFADFDGTRARSRIVRVQIIGE